MPRGIPLRSGDHSEGWSSFRILHGRFRDVLQPAREVDNVPDALTAAYENLKANVPSISDGLQRVSRHAHDM